MVNCKRFARMKMVVLYLQTTSALNHGRFLTGLDPDVQNFTISMPIVGAFLIGTSICCCLFFKYGLKRWRDRLRRIGRVKAKEGITYEVSLKVKKKKLEEALDKLKKLRYMDPERKDLKAEAASLKEELELVEQLIVNCASYISHSLEVTQRNLQALASKRVSIDKRESTFVNPIFSPLQSVACGYIIDPGKEDESIHNQGDKDVKSKELEMFLVSKGGGVRKSLLSFTQPTTLEAPISPVSLSEEESDREHEIQIDIQTQDTAAGMQHSSSLPQSNDTNMQGNVPNFVTNARQTRLWIDHGPKQGLKIIADDSLQHVESSPS